MKKVLILPSWYPNTNTKSGYFFKEQAHFLSENGMDVKVLMVEELNTKSYCFQRVKRLLNGKSNQLSKSFLEQEPEAFSFPVIIQKTWSDEKKSKVLDKAYLTAFKKIIKKSDWFPDIIHLQGMYKYGLSSYLISEEYNVPLVAIEHSPFRMGNYNKAEQGRIKKIFKVVSKIAGVSHFHKTCLSIVNTKREVEVVWNFMDENRFSYQTSLKSDDVFVITTILRASSVKDPITFFDAIARFVQTNNKDRSVEVNVVGLSGLDELTKMKDIDKNYISKYDHLHPILKFHSWLDRDEIEELHQKSSVFVSTSIDEPYGVALREAMLCGVPVISTRSGGPEDTINEQTGVLVEKRDYKAIAKSITDIYNSSLAFNSENIRNYVISQSGRTSFLESMTKFYSITND